MASLLVSLAVGLAWGEVGLEDPVQGDFILPAYLNLDAATLVLQGAKTIKEPLKLRVEFAEHPGGAVPREAVQLVLRPGERLESSVDISKWPDGDYRVTISGEQAERPPGICLIRWLRKQTRMGPPPPAEPIPVAGSSTLFIDDWYVHAKSGLRACREQAQPFGIVTHLLAPDSRQIGLTGGLEVMPDGSLQVGIRDADTDNAVNYYTARSADGLTWNITPNQPNVATPPKAQRSPFWRPAGTPVKPVAKTKVGQFRYYDARRDGKVALDQVDVVFTGADFQRKNQWGELTMPLRSAFPVWTKPDGESVILTREPLTADNHNQPDGQPGDWRDTNDNWIRPWRSADGQMLYYGQSRLIPRCEPFRTPYDHQKDILMGNYNRIMVLWQTRDGLHWQPSFFDPQCESDPVGWQGYGGSQFYAENGRLSLCVFFRYDARTQLMWPELLFSRNNERWCRLADPGPLVANGAWGSWNGGRMLGWYGMPVEKDGWTWQLFGIGDSRPHLYSTFIGHRRRYVTGDFLKGRFDPRILEWPFWERLGSWEGFATDAQTHCRTVGGMRYRKDRWLALRAEAERGLLVTRVFQAGSGLSLNARTQSGGELRVEVLDAGGHEIPSYCGADAARFSGDSLDASLTWRNGEVTQLPAGPLRLRLRLTKADLFALNWKP